MNFDAMLNLAFQKKDYDPLSNYKDTMGDVTRILPGTVTKIILARPWMSWVSRDQKFNVEYQYIGFLFDLPLIFE